MNISDILFPVGYKCFVCGRESNRFGICGDCYKELPFITGHTCCKCGLPITDGVDICIDCKGKDVAFVNNTSVFMYDGVISSKMSSFKFKGEKYLGDIFAKFIKEKFESIGTNFDVIIPVPIGEDRLIERGYNQSELLVKYLLEDLHQNISNTLIRLTNVHQTGLNKTNRKDNLLGVFKVLDKSVVKGKTVLVVDDIYTTGSTLNECAETLIKAGAKKVYGLTLCRTPVNYERILM